MLPRHVERHFSSFENQERSAQLGMWIFLSTEVLFFGGLFAAYATYRAVYPAAFVEGAHHMMVGLGTANTYLLITSSVLVALGVGFVSRGREGLSALALAGAAALGVAFLVIKGVEYASHVREGALPGQWYSLVEARLPGVSLYFTLYWIMTGLHALHVAIGIALLGWLSFQTASGVYTAEDHTAVEIAGLYWHFVDVVWIFLYPLLYLIA